MHIKYGQFLDLTNNVHMTSFHLVTSWQFWASGQSLHSEINPQEPHNGVLFEYKQEVCKIYHKIKWCLKIMAFAETNINHL